MSTIQIIGAVEVVVGLYSGNYGLAVSGAALLLSPTPSDVTQQGPRLNDLKVMSSQYGNPVPKVYGASRLSGNVVWSTDIIEISHSTESGGKGSSPTVTTTTYTYAQSFAVALCEGTIAGIGRIWANGKLIYNVTSTATVADIIASQRLAASMRVYTGSEAQTADSLIQAHVGAANTPAYRGTAYVVFENLQLADFGNRTPNLEFEIIQSGSLGLVVLATSSPASPYVLMVTNTGGSIVAGALLSAAGQYYLRVWQQDANLTMLTDQTIPPDLFAVRCTNDGNGNAYFSGGDVNGYAVLTKVGTNGFIKVGRNAVNSNLPSGIAVLKAASNKLLPFVLLGTANDTNLYVFDKNCTYQGVIPVNTRGYFVMEDSLGYVWMIGSLGAIGKYQLFGSKFSDMRAVLVGSWAGISTYDLNARTVIIEDTLGRFWFMPCNATGATPAVAVQLLNANGSVTTYTSAYVGHVSGTPVLARSITSSGDAIYFYVIQLAELIYFDLDTLSFGVASTSIALTGDLTASTDKTILYSANKAVSLFSISNTPVALSSTTSDICTRSGLTAGQIDVTQLTDTVVGYIVQRSTGRAQIEQLMQAFYFDAVESDGKIKFIKRGGSTVLTITEDDLAAYTYGGAMPVNLAMERRQEMELPVEMNVQYMETAAAYQVNSQRSQRLITNSSNKQTVNLAISMDASKAKQISDVLMFDAWTGRTTFGVMNGWKYSYLEPTDVAGVTKGAYTYNMRIVDEDAHGGVYNRSAVLEDASVYTQTANAAAPISPVTTVSSPPLLNLVLMDIPLLRDQDDGVGFYAAACAYSGTWTGEQTFKSNDGGATWSQSGRAILNEATIGTASTALSDFFGGNTFDEMNSVTVTMSRGTLSSDTELNVLNGANVLLLGNEILQFKNATLVATNTYTLTGLLRGRRGTEWAMSTHAAGDRAVLLSSTTTYIFDNPSSEYNLARKYRGVAIGGFLDDAFDVDFTNTAVAQECYSPVQLGGGRNAANDVILNWVRRTRIGGAWNDYADVPLGETSEAYTVEIYSSSTYATLKRTISGLTTPTTTYTAAQQTADGLTSGNTVYFIVYQISATVGTGYGARGSV